MKQTRRSRTPAFLNLEKKKKEMHTIREVGFDRRVHAHCGSRGLGRSVVIAPTRKMEPSSSRNNVCIIGWRRVRYDSGAASVKMAQFVGQVLQRV